MEIKMMSTQYYIIQSKDSNLIKKSSSGGVFAELARYVLSKGGVVFGCAMERVEEGFDVKHIYIENEKDLYKLQGSKYVQSNLGNTIKEAKEFLDEGRLVLFSGTPCHIAGLKAYLKKDYENLFTVDTSCTGTPLLKIFNDYVKFLENKYKKKIINFEFRNKQKMGWNCGNALITFENGRQKIIYNNLSSYLNLFITKRLQNPNCQNCKFAGLDRISDITLADAWGAEKEYSKLLKKKFSKNKGISLVLANTQQGNEFLNFIKENLIIENVDIYKLRKYNNPLTKKQKEIETKFIDAYKHGGYKQIEDLFQKEVHNRYWYYKIKNHTPLWVKNIIKVLIQKDEKADCLLMTWYHNMNYGSILTAWALQKTFSKCGLFCKTIHHSNFLGYAGQFKKNFELTKRCTNLKDYINLNKLSNTFVLGSDNLVNMDSEGINRVSLWLLNFTASSKKRLMISGSIGAWDGTTKNQEEHEYIKYLLNRFDYVSTREEHGKKVFENVFDVQADWINDPVFYLDKQDYLDLTKNVKQDYSNNIMQYILYPTKETQKIIEHYNQKTNFNIVKFHGNGNAKYCSRHKNKSVENWLSAIMNSKLVITDSFHCAAFALIFNKPIVCIKNTHATVRFISLFKRLGINVPLVKSVEDLKNINLDYDKNKVNAALKDIRKYALDKIEEAILMPKKNHILNEKMEIYNEQFMKNSIPWYKKNKLFYFGIIVPLVIPAKRIIADIQNEFNKQNV